jgi:hypothetical protein
MEEKDSPYRLHKHDKKLTCTYCIVYVTVIGSKPLIANNEWNGKGILCCTHCMDDIAENLPNPLKRRPYKPFSKSYLRTKDSNDEVGEIVYRKSYLKRQSCQKSQVEYNIKSPAKKKM